jgi:hypothetical protein
MSIGKEKRQKKPVQNFSRVYDVFVGTLVAVFLKGQARASKNSILFVGYLLDECDDFFYLGADANSISAAIKKDTVASIALHDTIADLDDMGSERELQ